MGEQEAPGTVDRQPFDAYIGRLSDGSRRTMVQALTAIATFLSGRRSAPETFPWAELRYPETRRVRDWLASRYAPTTANKARSALRGILRECRRLKLMGFEDFESAADLEPIRGAAMEKGRGLTADELAALYAACRADSSPAGVRDLAVLTVCYSTGVRRAELVALDLADIDLGDDALIVRHGKGDKARRVYLSDDAASALRSWLGLRGDQPGPVFTRIGKGGRLTSERLSDQSVWLIARDRAEEAGIARFTPHDLRRSVAGDLLDAGADLVTVQHILGHASPTTTAKYDRRGERAKKRAAKLLRGPARPAE